MTLPGYSIFPPPLPCPALFQTPKAFLAVENFFFFFQFNANALACKGNSVATLVHACIHVCVRALNRHSGLRKSPGGAEGSLSITNTLPMGGVVDRYLFPVEQPGQTAVSGCHAILRLDRFIISAPLGGGGPLTKHTKKAGHDLRLLLFTLDVELLDDHEALIFKAKWTGLVVLFIYSFIFLRGQMPCAV